MKNTLKAMHYEGMVDIDYQLLADLDSYFYGYKIVLYDNRIYSFINDIESDIIIFNPKYQTLNNVTVDIDGNDILYFDSGQNKPINWI